MNSDYTHVNRFYNTLMNNNSSDNVDMALADNLRALMERYGDNPNSLSQLTGVSQPAIFRIVEGTTKEPRRSNLEAIAKHYGVTVEELVHGVRGKGRTSTVDEDGIVIDQYEEARGSMGAGLILRDQPGQITGWRVTREWLHKNVPYNTGAGNLRIVTGFGDSMKGMFNSGDPLLIDSGIRSVDFDGVYFFRVGDEGFIKRLQRIPGQGIRVISENKAYEPWTITQDMDFEVFGRVLKVWQSDKF